jgi:predicted MFS family arabinose efflux permease
LASLTASFLLGGPLAGFCSNRIGSGPFAIGGMILGAASFIFLMLLPADFSYIVFCTLLFAIGWRRVFSSH